MSPSPLLQLRRTHSLGTNSSCDSSSDESRTKLSRRRCGLISRTNATSSTRSLTNLSIRKTLSSVSFHTCLLLVTLSQVSKPNYGQCSYFILHIELLFNSQAFLDKKKQSSSSAAISLADDTQCRNNFCEYNTCICN
jgi:hypothetical protein